MSWVMLIILRGYKRHTLLLLCACLESLTSRNTRTSMYLLPESWRRSDLDQGYRWTRGKDKYQTQLQDKLGLTGSSWAKLLTICTKKWSSVDRYRNPSGLDKSVVSNVHPNRTHRMFPWLHSPIRTMERRYFEHELHLYPWHVRESVTERMEKWHEPANKPRNFDRFFHPLGIEEGSFNEFLQCIETPFGVVFGKHYLEKKNGISNSLWE